VRRVVFLVPVAQRGVNFSARGAEEGANAPQKKGGGESVTATLKVQKGNKGVAQLGAMAL
jgi:hypothetical protein